MLERVVIIGAGQAGAQVAVSLRQLGFGGKTTLLGEERQVWSAFANIAVSVTLGVAAAWLGQWIGAGL